MKENSKTVPKLYFTTMALATGLTLVRGVALAAMMPVAEYGEYVIFVSIGMYLSIFLGMGEIEATMKSFPRAVAEGRGPTIRERANLLGGKLVVRASILLLPILLAGLLQLWDWHILALAAMAIAIAVSTGQIGIYASANRAFGDLRTLGLSAFMRSLLALAFCLAGGWAFDSPGAVLGEFLAAFLAIQYARSKLGKFALSAHTSVQSNPRMAATDRGGLWLLSSSIVNTAIANLDRIFIAAVSGLAIAAQYGVLLIIVTGASALYGLLAQKLGPEIIVQQHHGALAREQLRKLVPSLAGSGLLIMLGAILVAALSTFPPVSQFTLKYSIGYSDIFLAGMLGALQGTVLLDWILISQNRERTVFSLACLNLFILAALFCPLYFVGLTLENLLIWIILSKTATVVVTMLTLLKFKGA